MRRSHRSGFTLVELLAVVALIAITAGVALPMAAGWWKAQKLQEAIDDLRTDWIKARTLAMDDGRPYRFAIENSGRSYRIAPNELDYWTNSSSSVNAPPTGDPEEPQGTVIEKQLPDGILFQSAGDLVNLSPENTESTWLFLPDGRARLLDADGREHQQSNVILMEQQGTRRRQLTMRALTAQSQQTPLQQN
ncbi:MAG: prepilin-type N-terminal cleavage/methylation domain-containing protein [Gemmatales bacterium]